MNEVDYYDRTNLYMASKNGDLDKVKALLEAGADVNQPGKDLQTPLYIAAEKGHLEVVKALLAAEGVEVNQANNIGESPLYIAAYIGRLDIVNALHKNGADVNQATKRGMIPLHVAIHYDQPDVAKFLLESGAYDKPADNGFTALYSAIQQRDLEMVEAILDAKGVVSKKTLSIEYKKPYGNDEPKSVLMLMEELIKDDGSFANKVNEKIYKMISGKACELVKMLDPKTLTCSSNSPSTSSPSSSNHHQYRFFSSFSKVALIIRLKRVLNNLVGIKPSDGKGKEGENDTVKQDMDWVNNDILLCKFYLNNWKYIGNDYHFSQSLIEVKLSEMEGRLERPSGHELSEYDRKNETLGP